MSLDHLLNPLTSTPTYIKMTQEFDFTNHSHRRLNLLTNKFVLCSPHRAKRPWQGAKEEIKNLHYQNMILNVIYVPVTYVLLVI